MSYQTDTDGQVNPETQLTITSERVDDVALLIGQMKLMGLPQVLDKHIPGHWKQRELSWGWTAVLWLAYVLSEGDHRKVSVQEYIKGMKNTLKRLTGQEIDELDFTDDRLGRVLKYLSQEEYWHSIENELNERTIRVYDIPTDVARCDSTTVSGYHQEGEGTLFQFGHSKDDPALPQIKVMIGTLDPLGMPLATDVVSGERADDGLYVPIIERIHKALEKEGMLYVGDCKMSALDTRLHIRWRKSHYLCPLPLTGNTAEEMPEWIRKGVLKDKRGELTNVYVENNKDSKVLAAKGYEIERTQSGSINGEEIKWTERVLILRSLSYADQKKKGLEKRLENAQKKISALTPERGRGKKQITDEQVLKESVEKIVRKYKVEGLLDWAYEKEEEKKTKYVGQGRGSKNREKKVIEKVRYQITEVRKNKEKIEEEKEKFGWKVYVTDTGKEQLCLSDAVRCYRKEYRVEHVFNRLKSRLDIAPLFVKRNDQKSRAD